MKEEKEIEIPHHFLCPISLDIMKSPVTLSTGVTYDRSNIQRWLSTNNTCPSTMQILPKPHLLIPNQNLQNLIQIWSSSSPTQIQPASFVSETETNEKELLPLLMNTNRLKTIDSLDLNLIFNYMNNNNNNNNNLKFTLLACLKQESKLELRVSVLKSLNKILSKNNSLVPILGQGEELISEIVKLITTCDWNNEALDASLTLVTSFITVNRNNRSKFVTVGGVKALTEVLETDCLNVEVIEKVLKLLDIVSGCKEGRNEICGNEKCVLGILKKVLKVSSVASEVGVTILWSLCCLFCDERARKAVGDGNGVTKILLLLQSGCEIGVREMCRDLLRVFRFCNLKSGTGGRGANCVSALYDSKTYSHIMPF